MDEIEYKLNSKNPVLVTHGISKILETARQKIINNERGEDTSRIAELDSLFTKCGSENAVISAVACQALVSLVENGLLTIPATLSKFIAILGGITNYSAVTFAICNLLVLDLKMRNYDEDYKCPFKIKAPQHPLITVINLKNDAWRDVLGHMQSMIHQSKPKYLKHHVELFRPVFMYILCNRTNKFSESCRQQTWHLVIGIPETLHLQLDVLQWLRSDDSQSCIDTNNRILELAELAIFKKDIELCTAITPMIMSMALEFFKLNCDSRPNFVLMENILEYSNPNIGSIVVCLLAEIFLICSSMNLPAIIKLSVMAFDKLNCSQVAACSLVASILPWMAYANFLSVEALDIATNLINKIFKKSVWEINPKELSSNHIFAMLTHSNTSLQFYAEICSCMDKWNDENFASWLDKLSQASKSLVYKHRVLLSGIFLATNNSILITKTNKVICQIVKETPSYASSILSLVLYKLSNVRQIDEVKELLFMLPEMTVSKDNVPIVIHTLETLLATGSPLKYLAIELYLKAWKIEPRCHRHLLPALIDISKNDQTLRGNITCAKAMKFICENRPERGADLVPLLSLILNKCTDTAGSAASALALRGISALCVSGVADVCSTWRVLAPKMNKEERTIVIKSMCELFQDISENNTHSKEDFDNLLRQILSKLWEFSLFDTTRDMSVVQTAFKALAAYTVDQMKLSDLPKKYKTSLKPANKSDIQNSEEDSSAETDLAYIPGTCWVTMLHEIHEPARSMAGDLIIKFITDELYSFRTGIYSWPLGEPVNFKYLPEKSPGRAVGEFLRKYESLSTPEVKKVTVECLRIFSYKYIKALPPINFKLLAKTFEISDEARSYGISIACYQSRVSPSAREFLSKYLKEITNSSPSNREEFKKAWQLCTHFEEICLGVTSIVLGPFIEVTINYIVDRAIVDIENGFSMFEEMMDKYSRALSNDLINFDNKTLVANVLEKLLLKIDVDNKIFKFLVKALVQLPTEHIERITLPSVWEKITNEKLEKAIVVRAGLVVKRDNEIPLSWMNEMIRVSAPITGVHKCLLENMKSIQSQLRHEKSNADWCWDLMCRIQATILDTSDKNSIESAKFLSDLLFVTIIYQAFEDCLIELSKEKSVVTSIEVRARLFPLAISILASISHWKNTIQQTMEWLHFMRTSTLPISYKSIFHNALISLKNEKYLDDNCAIYFSTKGPLDLQQI